MTVIKLAQFEARGISSFIFTTTRATTEDGDDKNHKIMRVGHDIMIFDIHGYVVKLSMNFNSLFYNHTLSGTSFMTIDGLITF